MNLFKSTKHEVYKNLAEGLARETLRSYEDLTLMGFNDIEVRHTPIILEYMADYFLKHNWPELAYKIYGKINNKKFKLLENIYNENNKKYLAEYDGAPNIDKKLDEIMSNYEKSKNPEIPFVPPLFM
jgi:hypothetical protein